MFSWRNGAKSRLVLHVPDVFRRFSSNFILITSNVSSSWSRINIYLILENSYFRVNLWKTDWSHFVSFVRWLNNWHFSFGINLIDCHIKHTKQENENWADKYFDCDMNKMHENTWLLSFSYKSFRSKNYFYLFFLWWIILLISFMPWLLILSRTLASFLHNILSRQFEKFYQNVHHILDLFEI